MNLGRTHRIELPTPFRIGTVNAFLLEGDPLTLVDTGPRYPPSLLALEDALAGLGHRLEDLELVLLTHQHVDHVGLAAEISRRTQARVGAIEPLAKHLADFPRRWEADDEYAEGVMRRYGTPPERIRAIRALSASFSGYAESVHVDTLLEDGGQVDAGGRRLRVTTRPGHSPTDTIFVDEGREVAFVGDHLLPRVSSNPVIHRPVSGSVRVSDRQSTLARYLDSLARTRDLALAAVHPGHGDPVSEPAGLIDLRVRHHMERKETIWELIEAGLRTAPELAQKLWGDVETSQVYLALSEVVGHTDLLMTEGRVVEVEGDNAIVFEHA